MGYYVRVVSDSFKHINLIPIKEFDYYVSQLNPNLDHYYSLFHYSDEHKKIFDETKSVAGITNLTTPFIYFDLDSKNDLEAARKDALAVVSKLLSFGINQSAIQIYFSGNKGFHIIVETNQHFSAKELKTFVKQFTNGLKTFDERVYDCNRILRIPLTKHKSSNLFKIPLTVNELAELSINDIKFKASNLENIDLAQYQYTIQMFTTKPAIIEEKIDTDLSQNSSTSTQIDLSRKPTWLSTAKYLLQEGYFIEGERNTAFLILAATYKAQGFPKEITYRMLKGVAELQAKRNSTEKFPNKELWINIVQYVYSDTWKNGLLDEAPLLQTVLERCGLQEEKLVDQLNTTVPISSVESIFVNFAANIDNNTVPLGIPVIDKEIRITTSMLVGLLAAPSAGKTSIALNILNNMSKKNLHSIFFSFDMAAPLIYQRLIQKHLQLTANEIYNIFKNKMNDKIQEISQCLKEAYNNVWFNFSSGLTIGDMKLQILQKQRELGAPIKFICVDYLECIATQFSDPTASSAYAAQQLKNLANELDLTVLVLLQPQKQAGDPSDELLSMRNIKGASVIEQACSIIFTMWRPGFDPQFIIRDKFLSMAVVKNRMGKLGVWDFKWNGLTGQIEELSSVEKEELEIIKIEKLKKKKYDDL